jgi:hypothetical protein
MAGPNIGAAPALGAVPSNVTPFRRMPPRDELPAVELAEELDQLKSDPTTQAVTSFVAEAFRKAADYRASTGIDEEMRRAMRAIKNEYDPELKHLVEGVDIYMGVTNLKVRALISWIHDILMNAEDQPWTLKPTPDEELSDAMMEVVVQRLAYEIEKLGVTGDLTARAKELKAQAVKYKHKLSARAATAMTAKLKDQLLQGNWRDTFSAFVHDLAAYPTAILKGPFLEKHAELKWNGDSLQTRDVFRKTVGRVEPFDFFPAPNSSNCQDGAYVIERMHVDADTMLGYIQSPGFDELQIRQALHKYPTGYKTSNAQYSPDAVANNKGSIIPAQASTANPGEGGGFTSKNDVPSWEYELLVYCGKVPVSMLQEHGLCMKADPQMSYEAELWVIGEYLIKAVLNPHPLGHRPYYSTSFQRVPGQFWGQSLPFLLRDLQRIVNSAARSLVRNMGYSSGPIVEVDAKRMSSEEQLDMLEPWRVYYTDGADSLTPNNTPAIKFNVIPSIASELMKVMDAFEKKADDVSGIPAYVLGNPQVAGAGRTLGGLSMLMGNAAKGVKQVISNIDRFVIEPVIYEFYILEMLFGTDDTVKGDVAVVARGATGILQRELSRANAVEILQVITPYVQGGTVSPNAIKVLLRDIITSMGYEQVDELIEDPDRRADLLAALKAAGVDVDAIMAQHQAQQQDQGGPPIPGLPGSGMPGSARPAGAQTPNAAGPNMQRFPAPPVQQKKIKPPAAGTPIPALNLPPPVKLDRRSQVSTSPDVMSRIPGFTGT